MLDLKEAIDQLAMASSVCWHGHSLRKEDDHIIGRALDFVFESQRKNRRPKRSLKKQVEEDSVKVGLRRKDALCRSEWNVCIYKTFAGLR